MSRKDPDRPADDFHVNFFRPRPGFMRRKVIYTSLLLAGWAFLTFGFQVLLAFTGGEPGGEGPLTDRTFFGFPFHYWFTGQFLIVWFILLCYLFNIFIDHLTRIYHKKK